MELAATICPLLAGSLAVVLAGVAVALAAIAGLRSNICGAPTTERGVPSAFFLGFAQLPLMNALRQQSSSPERH